VEAKGVAEKRTYTKAILWLEVKSVVPNYRGKEEEEGNKGRSSLLTIKTQ